MKGHAVIGASLLLSIGPGVASQKNIKISTTSAKFDVKFYLEPGRTFSTNQLFRFESATSSLFHSQLSGHATREDGDSDSRVVVTSVHVERTINDDASAVENYDGDSTTAATLALECFVSVTFSEVGLNRAVKRSPIVGGWEDETALDVSSILTNIVSSSDLLTVLRSADLITDDATTVEFSFADFDGSLYQTGITATQTDIVLKNRNDGWPMFFAGLMLALLLVNIISVSYWLIKKEISDQSCQQPNDRSCKNSVRYEGDGDLKSVHYEGNVDLEVATTASGLLGLMGHHPNNENAHPNKKTYRRRLSISSSSKTDVMTNASTVLDFGSPQTHKTGELSASSKHPLGITSMNKLDSFLTPQKLKSNRVKMYDIERLTRT